MSFHPYLSDVTQNSIHNFHPGSYRPAAPNMSSGYSFVTNPGAFHDAHTLGTPYLVSNNGTMGGWTTQPQSSSYAQSPFAIHGLNARVRFGSLFAEPKSGPAVYNRLISKELQRYRSLHSRAPSRLMLTSARASRASIPPRCPTAQGLFRPVTNGSVSWPDQKPNYPHNGTRLFGSGPFHPVGAGQPCQFSNTPPVKSCCGDGAPHGPYKSDVHETDMKEGNHTDNRGDEVSVCNGCRRLYFIEYD